MTDPAVRRLASRFAAALDRNDFETVAALLSPDCRYETLPEPLVGPTAIIESYRSADARARALFDRVEYESAVVAVDGDSVVIKFVDILEHRRQRHVYSCEQEVTVSRAGTICRIVQRDIPEEKRALYEFVARVGVTLD